MNNELLQHTVSTIKYRFDKSISNSSCNFGDFNLGKGSRTSIQIINHMYNVIHSTRIFIEEEKYDRQPAEMLDLTPEIERLNGELLKLSMALDVNELPIKYAKKLLQGPLSDVLTHIGQISMMQRLDGHPIDRENFAAATIKTGLCL